MAKICDSIASLPGVNRVLIVDDGSVPPVTREGLPVGVRLVRLPSNYGIGLCNHVAIDYFLSGRADVLVRIDADGQHPTHEIPRLAEAVRGDECDLAIGVRTNAGAATGIRSLAARAVRAYIRLIARLLTDGRVPGDINSGFYAMNRSAAATFAEWPLERYPEPEMMIIASLRKLRILGVPIEQGERLHGRSTITVGRAFQLLLRFNALAMNLLIDRLR